MSVSCVLLFIKLTVKPSDRYAFKEDHCQQDRATCRVFIEQIEEIHPSLTIKESDYLNKPTCVRIASPKVCKHTDLHT